MTDRQAASPGQYSAVVSLAELAKMQNGESFVIHLTRDDNPLTEGTPYNKESVLPDELAKKLCPDVPDPKPADALAALLPLLGGKMNGPINMGGNAITGLSNPVNNNDAVSLSYMQLSGPFANDKTIKDESVANTSIRTGFYRVTYEKMPAEERDFPFSTGGVLLVLNYDNKAVIYVAFSYTGDIKVRSHWYGTWHRWRTVSASY